MTPPLPSSGVPTPVARSLLAAMLLATIVACLAGWQTPAAAQVREFPQNTKVGVLQMGVYPLAAIDGKEVRFAPGARILNQGNAVVIPSTLTERVRIRYRIDELGQVSLAWILTDEEFARSRRR